MTNPTAPDTLPRISDTFQADWQIREANEAKFYKGDYAEPCFLCGRPLTTKAMEKGWWIHLFTDGTLAQGDDERAWEHPESQGAFPVGSECAKKIPRAYRLRMKWPTT